MIVGAMIVAVAIGQMLTGAWLMPVLLLLLTLIPMVLLHEWGHFWVARRFDIGCKEFFIGFGPRLWSFTRGETEYGVKAGFPLGGYVRIVGMSQYEEVEQRFAGRTFRDAKPWKRMLVLFAGPTTHFIMAIVIMFLILAFAGNPLTPPEATTTIRTVSDGSAAAQVGLAPGATIIAINGVDVAGNWDEMTTILRANPDTPVTITYEANGVSRTVTAVLGTVDDEGETVGRLGVSPTGERDLEPFGAAAAVPETFVVLGEIASQSGQSVGRMFTPSNLSCLWNEIVGGECRTDDRFSSPVGIAVVANATASSGWVDFAVFLVVINLFVGAFNLLPLLPFDGGHLAVLAVEKIRSEIAGHDVEIDQTKLVPITAVVLVVLGLILLSSLYLDIFRITSGDGIIP